MRRGDLHSSASFSNSSAIGGGAATLAQQLQAQQSQATVLKVSDFAHHVNCVSLLLFLTCLAIFIVEFETPRRWRELNVTTQRAM